jgi:hypothetical protein
VRRCFPRFGDGFLRPGKCRKGGAGLPRTHFVCTVFFFFFLRVRRAHSLLGRIPASTLAQACSAARRTCL